MRARPLPLVAFPALVFLAGCDDDKPKSKGPQVKARETIGKTTQVVKKLEDELKSGAVLAPTTISNSDYLTQNAEAYRTSVAKIGGFAVDQAIAAYEIQNNAYPKTHEEFMENIIRVGKPDGIQLAMLPYYQEYSYDVENHKLVVLEYPAKKAQFKKQQDEDLGRR
jgi:hypothetical protein